MKKVCISPSCSPKKYTAQPASEPGDAAQPTFSTSDAARPTLTVGFYNVNIHSFSETDCGWKIIENRLESDITKAFEIHALDILCLCGLTSNMMRMMMMLMIMMKMMTMIMMLIMIVCNGCNDDGHFYSELCAAMFACHTRTVQHSGKCRSHCLN